jgi:hypothetical protein
MDVVYDRRALRIDVDPQICHQLPDVIGHSSIYSYQDIMAGIHKL